MSSKPAGGGLRVREERIGGIWGDRRRVSYFFRKRRFLE
jgi:hypothetical protein